MKIEVTCYSGYRGEETPRRIRMGDRKIEVKEIKDRWLDPNHRYFKVLGDDHVIYILRHDSESWDWDLTFYEFINIRTPITYQVTFYHQRAPSFIEK